MRRRCFSMFAAIAAVAGLAPLAGQATEPYPTLRLDDANAQLPDARPPDSGLLKMIIEWLSSEFGLPAITDAPGIAFVPSRELIAMRYPLDKRIVSAVEDMSAVPEVVAIYRDLDKTIYFSDTWSGRAPAEVSVLVHEIVHHIQHQTGLRDECPEAREKLAFEAQERWLALFGSSLEKEFGIDAMTLHLRTHCFR